MVKLDRLGTPITAAVLVLLLLVAFAVPLLAPGPARNDPALESWLGCWRTTSPCPE